MTLLPHASAPEAAPRESKSAEDADDDRSHTAKGKVIPVGQEPPPIVEVVFDGPEGLGDARVGSTGVGSAERRKLECKSGRTAIRNPEGLRRYNNALREIQVFRKETLRHLRRAEIAVWLGIHGCQGPDGARITYERLAEITGASRKHVGVAIKSLKRRGLLEVLQTGRFRPGSRGESGLASLYRVYPSPEPRLLERCDTENQDAPHPDDRRD